MAGIEPVTSWILLMKSNSNLRCFLAAPGSQCLAIFIDPHSSSLSSGQPEINAYQHSVWNTVCPLPESLQLERVCHPSAKLVCSQNRAGLCMCQQHQRSRTVYHQCLKFADVLAQMSAWICQLILHRRERKLMHQRKLALKIFYCRLFWQFLIAKLFWQLSQWNMTQTRIGFNKQGCKNPDLPSICLRYYLFSPSCVFTDQPSSVAVSKTHESLTAT